MTILTENQLIVCKVGNGALAGIAGITASFPLDLIKTNFQLNKEKYRGKFINAARGNYCNISTCCLIKISKKVFYGYQIFKPLLLNAVSSVYMLVARYHWFSSLLKRLSNSSSTIVCAPDYQTEMVKFRLPTKF